MGIASLTDYITDPLVSLSTAILAGLGLVIGGGIVVYGLIRAVRVMKRVFSDWLNDWDDHGDLPDGY